MKFLIVEDEYHIRNGLTRLIPNISPSYQVAAFAEDGREGLLCARKYEPDVVITDIMMPKLDGLEMVRAIQALGLNPEFVVLSGYADFEYARKAIRLGVKEYLLKPISVNALTETLQRIEKSRKEESPGGGFPAKEAEAYSAVVAGMVRTIREQYGKHLNLELFADQYKMTPEYLSTLFTHETHMTFSKYLKNIRIEKAKDLLENSDMKIYEIACMVGYPEQKYFSKVFKDCVGVSAKRYALERGSGPEPERG